MVLGGGVLLLCFAQACDREPVGSSRAAVEGGRLATEATYDAVMCTPRYIAPENAAPGVSCTEDALHCCVEGAGWAGCVQRCVESMTLVTPRIAVGSRHRLITQSHPFALGAKTYGTDASADEVRPGKTALEVGVALNAVDDGPSILRHATGCYELRRSGIAPCCRHVRYYDTSLPTETGRAPYQRIYAPPPELWDERFSSSLHLVPTGLRRMRGHPVGAAVSSQRGVSLPFRRPRDATWAPRAVPPSDLRACHLRDLRAAL